MDNSQLIDYLKGKLIVSCQALPDEPLHGSHIMAQMAVAVKIGGADAIRANSPEDIRAIRTAVDLPIIGLDKYGDTGVYITPTLNHVQGVIDAGADVIAFDATKRPHPDGSTVQQMVDLIHAAGRLALADVSVLDEGLAAMEAGADFVASTLSGYTDYSPPVVGPDFALMEALVKNTNVPVIAEGHISTPELARTALDCGAWAVVVGSAITRPRTITARFAAALQDLT